MMTLRRRAPFWVATWLIFQVSAVSALVPRECCAAHRHANDTAHHSHDGGPAATSAAPRDAHAGHQMDHGSAPAADPTPLGRCVMRGTCDGPMSAILALLSTQGIPPTDTFTVIPDLSVTLAAGFPHEHLTSRLASPDSPPPRA